MRRRALKAILISAAITAAAFLFVAAPAWQDRLADPSWPKMALPLLFILAPYAYLALLEKLAWSKSLHDPAAKPRRIFVNDYALVRKFDFIEVASALTCIRQQVWFSFRSVSTAMAADNPAVAGFAGD